MLLILVDLPLLYFAPSGGQACLGIGFVWFIGYVATAPRRHEKERNSLVWQQKLQLVADWEATQRLWEDEQKRAKQAEQAAWDREQHKSESEADSVYKTEYAGWEAEFEEWQRRQANWVERQRVDWATAQRNWKAQKVRHDGLRLDYEHQLHAWKIKQVEWEKRIRTQWEVDYRQWKAKEQAWQRELYDRKLVQEAISNSLKSLEANYESDWNALFDTVTTYRLKLYEVRDRYVPAVNAYEAKRRELAGKAEEYQRRNYLRSFVIADANIERINSRQLASLQSFGIETAWDIEDLNKYQIPYVKDRTKEKLLNWRDWHVSKFRYNPNLPSPELIALERSHRATVTPWEAELAAGPGRLRELVTWFQSRKGSAMRQIQTMVDQLYQAELDVEIMERTLT